MSSSASDKARIGFLQNLVNYLASSGRSGPTSRPTGDIIFNCGAGGGSASCPPSVPCPPASSTSEISLQDLSTKGRYTAQDLETLAAALNIHLQKFCDDWNFELHTIKVYPKTATVNARFRCYLKDTSDISYASGYHNVNPDGVAEAFAFIETIGANRIFTDPDAVVSNGIKRGTTVPSVLCHEIFETLTNYYVNKLVVMDGIMNFYDISKGGDPVSNFYDNIYVPNINNTLFILTESANPVQCNFVSITVGGKTVELTDYVLPTWFSAIAKGPYNSLKTLTRAFQIDIGGYIHFFFNNVEYFNSRTLVI